MWLKATRACSKRYGVTKKVSHLIVWRDWNYLPCAEEPVGASVMASLPTTDIHPARHHSSLSRCHSRVFRMPLANDSCGAYPNSAVIFAALIA